MKLTKLKTLALKDMKEFGASTYLVPVRQWTSKGIRKTYERRKRYLTREPLKRLGEKIEGYTRLRSFGSRTGVILYSYYTLNGRYRNYLWRVLLLDGPKKGKIVSI